MRIQRWASPQERAAAGDPNAHLPLAEQGPGPVGSGIVLTSDGLVLTNHHLVEGARRITLRTHADSQEHEADIVGSDAATDIALLRVRGEGPWTPALLADSRLVQVGDVVLAVGSPLGLDHSVTLGIISGTGRSDLGGVKVALQDFIQTDAAIHPGNSGGPLVDGLGRVLGVNSAHYGSSNIGLAVPIHLALKVADDLLRHGRVQRGHLGVRLVNLTPGVLAQLELLPGTRGVVVQEVEAGNPGDRAGLRPGDIITTLDGLPVTSAAGLRMRMTLLQAGDTCRLTLLRSGSELTREVVLGEPADGGPLPETLTWSLLPGLRVALLVLENDLKGEASSQLRKDDLILQINDVSLHAVRASPDMAARLRFKTPILMLKVLRNGTELLLGIPRPAAD
jgi:S1-C subfamily serine protease